MTPVEATKKKNESTVYFNLYGNMEQLVSKPKFKVGDKVRISKYKRKVFDNGYTPSWTEEIFLVDKIQSTNPITYRLKDLNNEEIQGSFYEPESLKATQDIFPALIKSFSGIILGRNKLLWNGWVIVTTLTLGFHQAVYKIYLTNSINGRS